MLFYLYNILEKKKKQKQNYNYGEKTRDCQEFRNEAESWLGEAQKIFLG